MVKRFSLKKTYGLLLVRTGEDGEPYTWTVKVRYSGTDKNGWKWFWDCEHNYRIKDNEVQIRERFDTDEDDYCIAGLANIVDGGLVCY